VYHRFRRAIAYVKAGKLHVHTEAEQQIWNECSRLIANAVIYYNAAISSRVLQHKQAAADDETVEILKGILPVAWQHINLFGRFEFNKRARVDLPLKLSQRRGRQRHFPGDKPHFHFVIDAGRSGCQLDPVDLVQSTLARTCHPRTRRAAR
jgi:Tn3 transposase DDE domain